MRFLLPSLLLSLSAVVSAGEARLWLAGALEDVSRQEPPRETRQVQALQAARGEWESLQAVLHGDAKDLAQVRIVELSLTHAESGEALPAPRLYHAQETRLEKSAQNGPLPEGARLDALQPLQGSVLSAKPETGRVVLWMDVQVPYTARTGRHEGRIGLQLADERVLLARFSVDVWDFDLPTVSRLRSLVGVSAKDVARAHGLPFDGEKLSLGHAQLMNQYYDLLAEHRLAAAQVHGTLPEADGSMSAEKVAYSLRKHLLHRHAAATTLPLRGMWPFADPLGADRTRAEALLGEYGRVLESMRCTDRGVVMIDTLGRPADAASYELVRQWGTFLNETEAKTKSRLPLLVVTPPTPARSAWGKLHGMVDIWAVNSAELWMDMEWPGGAHECAMRRKAGEELWLDTKPAAPPAEWLKRHAKQAQSLTHSHPPVIAPAFPPMAQRVTAWLLLKYGVTGLHHEDALDLPAEAAQAWSTLPGGSTRLIYAATQSAQGIEGPVPSLRLKGLRDLVEDYDLLMMAREQGLDEKARQIADSFARALDDWDANPAALLAARLEVARFIETAMRRRQTAGMR
jgi:hypothetical protein